MSITHSLMMATEMTPAEVREWLLNNDVGLTPDQGDYLRGTGVYVSIGDIHGLRQEVVEEDYGVRANRCIYFDMESGEIEGEGERIIGRAIAAFLKHEPGDAVLLYVGEIPVLQRIAGRVVITDEHNEYSEWLTPPLDAAGVRYERQHALTPTA